MGYCRLRNTNAVNGCIQLYADSVSSYQRRHAILLLLGSLLGVVLKEASWQASRDVLLRGIFACAALRTSSA